MKLRKIVIKTLLVIIGLPVILALFVVVSFYMALYESDRANGTIVSAGQEREYLLYVPASYDRSTPTPLVVSLHAAMLWPAAQREISQWNRVADEHGFIVVYPSGLTPQGGGTGVAPKLWEIAGDLTLSANVGFISQLLDTLEATYNIDTTRIYANGFSNGGAMVFALSCRLSHRIAAVGTVSAAQDQRPWSWCQDEKPMPLIKFHGTSDLVPYEGGRTWASPKPFPSVSTWTANWAARNRCASSPVESIVAADVTRREYTHCANDATVVLYIIKEGGHNWPGGKPLPEWLLGSASQSIDATSQMWAFFIEHQLLTE